MQQPTSDAGSGHLPVLFGQAIEALSIRPDGVYVDATFGRGGHSGGILARLGKGGRLIAIDRDPQAVALGRAWQAEHKAAGRDGRFVIEHAWFSEIDRVLDGHGVERVDGVLLDLGVSSPQLDDAARGFSFKADGPLDMRMDPTRGQTAREWLLQATTTEIAEVVREYGQERFAVQIAASIEARRRDAGDAALRTTGELARLVAGVVRSRQKRPEVGKDPATRTFQAVRIHINQELAQLTRVLDRAVARLSPGGRLVVIAFHSLEDRMVKQFMTRESGRMAPRDPITGRPLAVHARLADPKRVLPDESEAAANPRARSAVLRHATRTTAPADAVAIGAQG